MGRYSLALLFSRFPGFPYGTLAANTLGGLIMGICVYLMVERGLFGQWKLFVMVGALGGFTTFSSFGSDTFLLVKQAAYQKAIIYVLLTNFAVLSCVFGGYFLAKKILFD